MTHLNGFLQIAPLDGPLLLECPASRKFAVYTDGVQTRITHGGHYAQPDLVLQDISCVQGYRHFCVVIEVIHTHPPSMQALEILRAHSEENGQLVLFIFVHGDGKSHRLSQYKAVGGVLYIRCCRYIHKGKFFRNDKPFHPRGETPEEQYADLRMRFFGTKST